RALRHPPSCPRFRADLLIGAGSAKQDPRRTADAVTTGPPRWSAGFSLCQRTQTPVRAAARGSGSPRGRPPVAVLRSHFLSPDGHCNQARRSSSARRVALHRSLSVLNDRERSILVERRLSDDPISIEALAKKYGVSRERVRQIEIRAFQKVQD